MWFWLFGGSMLKLNFVQKVGLGFIVIVILLLTSSLLSLWNLNAIKDSSQEVNNSALPAVKETNKVQIQLLKQVTLSAQAYNALTINDVENFKKDFETYRRQFVVKFSNLEDIVKDLPEIARLLASVKTEYTSYTELVTNMLESKSIAIQSKQRVADEVNQLINLVDDTGETLVEMMYLDVDKSLQKSQEFVAGVAGRVDGILLGAIKSVEEIQTTLEQETFESELIGFQQVIDEVKLRMQRTQIVLEEELNQKTLWSLYEERLVLLKNRFEEEEGLQFHKKAQLFNIRNAREKFDESNQLIQGSIDKLDVLLNEADDQFNRLQNDVNQNIEFGYNSNLVALIVILLLTAQNFNAMRIAIRNKVVDLAKINRIGRSLVVAPNQTVALEGVLSAFHRKFGVEQGSVFMKNHEDELELKACYPPKSIEPGHKPITFIPGEGVIGQAAESKKTLYIPNTSQHQDFVLDNKKTPRALLCVPLIDNDIVIGVMNFSGTLGKVTFSDSDYEFVDSIARNLVTTIKNLRMREVIEAHARDLEHKVELRTQELHKKNQDVANMMANMHQGLFTISDCGLIRSEYSKYLEVIFETRRIANRHFKDFMFTHAKLGADELNQICVAVESIIGESDIMFEFNSHLLKREIVINLNQAENKILELSWDPIIQDDIVEQLMVTVRDITQLKALEAEAELKKEELNIIGEILAVGIEKFENFVNGSLQFIDESHDIISRHHEKSNEAIAVLFRNMHTIKGNARTYGFKKITDVFHIIEQTYDVLRKEENLIWDVEVLLSELSDGQKALEIYQSIYNEKLKMSNTKQTAISINPEKVSRLLNKIKQLTSKDVPENVVPIVQETFDTLVAFEAQSLETVISGVTHSVNELAHSMEKLTPKIHVENDKIHFLKEGADVMNNVFMHMFRNAMDHGIEKPEEREEKGKSPQGSIYVKTTIENNQCYIWLSDDGRGIAIDKIYGKALETGILSLENKRPSDTDIANLIFHSGLSTADKVTDISGRGVGMDAVKAFIKEQGGEVELILDEAEKPKHGYKPFALRILLPKSFYRLPPVFQRVG